VGILSNGVKQQLLGLLDASLLEQFHSLLPGRNLPGQAGGKQ
jgi:hypothetical protein